MAEYVKKEDVLALAEWEAFYNEEEDDYEEFECIYPMAVRLMPAADVVEVVRCKDCRFCSPYLEEWGETTLYCRKYYSIDEIVNADDFCSYGERKE